MAMMNPHVPRRITALITLFFLSSAQLSFSVTNFHDLLATYNLPKGLIPKEIKSYSLSTVDNVTFSVELSPASCYVLLTPLLFLHYDRTIKGKLGFGNVSDVSGIQVWKVTKFVFAPITEFIVEGDKIEYYAGFPSEKTSVKDFEKVHSCALKPKGVQELAGYVMDAAVV